MVFKSEQEKFWADTYAEDYIAKNSQFNHELGAVAWGKMLASMDGELVKYLECGCNIGRNIEQIRRIKPLARASVIEISKPAFQFVSANQSLEQAFNGAILDSAFEPCSFDLVFTMGVLIHINPDQLVAHMQKMLTYSKRYVLMGEYFSRTPESIVYQGEYEKLFKRDFGKLFLENFSARLVDYGFLWGHLYDSAGFDDITWWLFEKT